MRMKNFFYSLLVIMILYGNFSCSDSSFLDETVTTDLDYTKVFSDSALVEGFLSEIYREIGFDIKGNRFSVSRLGESTVILGGLQTACDEAEFRTSSEVTADLQFAMGTVNPVVISDDAWKIPYQNIRRVNIFLQGIEQAPLQNARKVRLKAEARFLRAWYYHILVRHYGGVPLIGDVIYAEGDELKNTRDTYDDCLKYIIQECETAEKDLGVKPSGVLYGRAGGGACKALVARMKLYAASPLFNGNSDIITGTDVPAELIGYPEYSKERWKEAMDAAYSFLTLGRYQLYVLNVDPKKDNASEPGFAFYALFFAWDATYRPASLVESIFEDRSIGRVERETWYSPPSFGGGNSGFPYQNLVDTYPMRNGKAITDAGSGYDPNHPYKGRDPRFYNTICCDSTFLPNLAGERILRVNTYLNVDGSSSGKDAVHQGTTTGYYINKMVSREWAANAVHGTGEITPLMRYAEIYMIYAEAMNEYNIANGGESGIVPAGEATYTVLKDIRARAGIDAGADGMYGLKSDMTRLEMREAIRNERRIEFAFEGMRFFDVRRWKIAEQTDNQMMTGMEIQLKANGGKSYTRFDVRQRAFRKAMYFWPIPYSETSKAPTLIQNPNY